WLAKVGQKLYALSREGRQVVRRLFQDGDTPAPEEATSSEPMKASPDQEKLLQALLASSAYSKFREGRKNDLTFADACRFWNVTESLSGEHLDSRLNRVQAGLAEVERRAGLAGMTLSSGRALSADELSQ